MTRDESKRRFGQYRGAIATVTLISVIYLGTYLNSPNPQWSFSSETVLVEKTITHTPWWVDATGPASIVLLTAVVIWGVSGGFPRP